MFRNAHALLASVGAAALLTVACPAQPTDDATGEGEGEGEGEGVYAFQSRFIAGESSVSYTGQAGRHLLLQELKARIGRTDDTVIDGKTAADLKARFTFLYDFKADNGGTAEEPITVTAFGTALTQTQIGEVGVVSLRDKMRDHDLDDATAVIGWGADDLAASAVAEDIIERLTLTMIARQTAIPQAPDGTPITQTFLSASGVDHQQLLENYLLGAVAFSQGCDDYLDDSTVGKGILSDNAVQVEGKPFTELEHAWDEAFGYFGAARAFATHSVADNVGGFVDADGNGSADWLSEVNYGHARTAAQRDESSATSTRFGYDAVTALVEGRRVITAAAGPLSTAQLDTLRSLRGTIEQNWERALAATAIRSINDIVVELGAEPATYSFVNHTTLWSELKGVLLSLQFNPRSPMLVDGAARLRQAHELVGGDAPVIARAGFADAVVDFTALRTLLQVTYRFDERDVAAW